MMVKQMILDNFKMNNPGVSTKTMANARSAVSKRMTVGNVVYVNNGGSMLDAIRLKRTPKVKMPVKKTKFTVAVTRDRDAFGRLV